VVGILSTSFYQIWVKTKQQDLGLDSYQLLYYQAPISAVMVFVVTPFFDQMFTTTTAVTTTSRWGDRNAGDIRSIQGLDNHRSGNIMSYNARDIGLFDYPMSMEAFTWIMVSCVLAFCVNLSIFLTIGYTSPISYNVLGHFKLCVITIGGIILFREDANQQKILGVIMALVGIIWYSLLKVQLSEPWDKRIKNTSQNKDTDDKTTDMEGNKDKERGRNGHNGTNGYKNSNVVIASSKN